MWWRINQNITVPRGKSSVFSEASSSYLLISIVCSLVMKQDHASRENVPGKLKILASRNTFLASCRQYNYILYLLLFVPSSLTDPSSPSHNILRWSIRNDVRGVVLTCLAPGVQVTGVTTWQLACISKSLDHGASWRHVTRTAPVQANTRFSFVFANNFRRN